MVAGNMEPDTKVAAPSQKIPWTPIAIGGMAAVAAAAFMGGATLMGQGRKWFLFLFTRLDQDRLLDRKLRAQIHNVVKEHPGIHLREIMRMVEREKGVVQHHLDILAEGQLLHSQAIGGFSRYFAIDVQDAAAIQASAALRHPNTMRVLEAILKEPGATLEGIAQDTGLSYQATSDQARKLRNAGLITAEREMRIFHLHATDLARVVAATRDRPARDDCADNNTQGDQHANGPANWRLGQEH